MKFEQTVIRIIAEQVAATKPTEITRETKFDDLGLDSLDLIEVIMSVEDEFGIDIDNEEIYDTKTVGPFVEYLERTFPRLKDLK